MPVLSANLVWAETREPVEYVQPYLIKDYGGIKVAIIGMTTTDTPEMAFPAHVEPVAVPAGEIETAAEVRSMRCASWAPTSSSCPVTWAFRTIRRPATRR